jgi:hypothetical protein
LQTGATGHQIRSAYHVLVKVWHPDRFQHDPALRTQAEEKLKGINAAFRYLTSTDGQRDQRQPPQAGQDPSPRGSSARDSKSDRSSQAPPSPNNLHREESSSRNALLKAFALPLVVRRFAFVAALALIGWILFMPIDSFLASEPLTSGPYRQYKTEVWQGFVAIGVTISDRAGQVWHGSVPRESLPVTPPASLQEPDGPAAQKASIKRPSYPVQTVHAETGSIGALPYVTAGLNKAEVIAIQGTPTSSSENELLYGHSELYFKNDKLVGWKIDPASPEIRVKLWPDAPVDPDRDTFWVGSSKSEVIAIQGTPTLWSENTFGYGGSEVYFRNGRVVNWKNDPATVQLRAAQR